METRFDEDERPPYINITPSKTCTGSPVPDSSSGKDVDIIYAQCEEDINIAATSSQDEMVSSSSDNYLKELCEEKELLHPVECKHTLNLLKEEISRISKVCENPSTIVKQYKQEGHVCISEKLFYPSNKQPSYDFVMNLIGPRGSNIKNIAHDTNTNISILGQGSTKDRYSEGKLSKSDDPVHQHFKEPFHVLLQAAGPKHTVEEGLNAAVDKIKMYMDEDLKYRESNIENVSLSSPSDEDPYEKVSLSEKVFFPEHSSPLIISTLLGPKGSNLQRITASTKTRISILGKGSMRDKTKEEDACKSGEPKYKHLNEPLHALIQAAGPRHIAQFHLNSALTEIKRHIKDDQRGVEHDTSYLSAKSPFENEEFANLSEKIFFPIDKYPSANFIGALLGPKGSILKSIASATKARISILGRGSTKDIGNEKVLGNNNDNNNNEPKYKHLNEPLHVFIQVAGPRNVSKGRLNAAMFEINRCIDEEINRVLFASSDTSASSSQLDKPFDDEQIINLTEKVYFPVDRYPTFNFVGRLLGPKGSNLRSIAAQSKSATKTNISILGKGSTKDKRLGAGSEMDDRKCDHLQEPLHVLVNVSGPKEAAELRLHSAVEEIKKYTDPENVELINRELHEHFRLNSPTLAYKYSESLKDDESDDYQGQSSSRYDYQGQSSSRYDYQGQSSSRYQGQSSSRYGAGVEANYVWSDDGKKCRISYQ